MASKALFSLLLVSCSLWLTAGAVSLGRNAVDPPRNFTIDPNTRWFLKDGQPFRYVSGCFHYFRSIKENWKDIMTKMRGAGLNVIQTYVEWSSHEPEPGVYNFDGNLDVVTFIKTAQEVGLLVILRPGPYICAERDYGGLPYWLLREKQNIGLRSMDDVYMKHVNNWFGVLLPMMEPLLYKNGGPIILVQVENEYGEYYKCDHDYMTALRDLNQKYLGTDVILFRTDMPTDQFYQCDSVDGVMVTADFGVGTDVRNKFDLLQHYNPTQPSIVTEFYPGWMDYWGQKHAEVDTDSIIRTLNDILALNGSVSFYMFFGGTNFGFTNGANGNPYNPIPTSYDYEAPINEAGDVTDKFFKVRDAIGKYLPLPPAPSPTPAPKFTSGPLTLNFVSTLLNSLQSLNGPTPIISSYPKTFEAVSLDKGFMAYSSVLKFQPRSPTTLQVDGLRDRGYVYVNAGFRGVLDRHENTYSIPIAAAKGDTITIVVENQGRINNFGWDLEFKGLVSNVTVASKILDDWTMVPIPLNDTQAIHQLKMTPGSNTFEPAFYSTSFVIPNGTELADTFLDPTGWHKGVAILNGFNLGRYWPVMGPQVTLYAPKQLFKSFPDKNILTVLELEGNPCTGYKQSTCLMSFVANSILDGPVPD